MLHGNAQRKVRRPGGSLLLDWSGTRLVAFLMIPSKSFLIDFTSQIYKHNEVNQLFPANQADYYTNHHASHYGPQAEASFDLPKK